MNKIRNILIDCVLLFSGLITGAFSQTNVPSLDFTGIYIKYIIPLALFIFAIAIIITKNKNE